MTISAERQPRPRKCKAPACRAAFVPARPLQAACSPQCALDIARQRREKETALAARKERAEAKQKLKRRADYVREAQQAVNAYVRARDADLPCISCGRWHDGQWHAGHYLSTGARPNLRFDEQNIHKQCQPCNTHLSGNLVNYRRRLIEKIGIDAVEGLESDQAARKWSVDDLIAIRKQYVEKRKAITRGSP